MTDQYPLDAWGIEMIDPASHRWLLLEGHVYGHFVRADRGFRELVEENVDPKEIRIVPLTLTKRDRP